MKKNSFIVVIAIAFFLSLHIRLSAQEKLQYWNDSETFLQDQASLIFEEASKILETYPPETTVGSERKLALLSLDALLHDTRLDGGAAFMSYMKHTANKIITELQSNKPIDHEVRFFRLYDHGFIVQTPTATIGIDLIRGGKNDNPFVNDALIRSIVDQCDILFITHAHGDHADRVVAEMFHEQGKEVIVPEKIWENTSSPLHILRGEDVVHEKILLPGKKASITVSAYPGHQGNVLNNVYVITLPEGQTIMHTGDQDYSEELITQINQHAKRNIDVLLVQCWMIPMEKFISGINPAFVICGHENEMEHSIDHREAYWLTFRRMADVKVPYLIMAWGESYKYITKKM